MAQPQVTEGVTENVDSILFGLMTDDAVRKLSFKKITNPVAFTGLGNPTDGGLYDPSLGPFDTHTVCRSCGQRSFLCPGHCGHIDLVLPVYNPLLFKDLLLILKKTCFHCERFKMEEEKVKIYAKMLECIISGNIMDARKLDSCLTIGKKSKEMLEVASLDDDETETSTSPPDDILSDNMSGFSHDNRWTSLQYDMLKNALNKFWSFSSKKCKNCSSVCPTLRGLNFCWIHMEMKVSDVGGNVLRGKKLNLMDEDTSVIALDDNADSNNEGFSRESSVVQNGEISEDEASGFLKVKKGVSDEGLDEFRKQMKIFSGHLLPIEARNLMKQLWANEGYILQLMFDIQCQGRFMSGDSKSHRMFFMETVLVPGNKFRPPSKGSSGDVIEHSQSIQLSNVLLSNVRLTNAYKNSTRNERTVRGWMDLQDAVSVFFDSRKAMNQKGNKGAGLSELLERKEGIFRQKMMGKRVNFACRSVISPDPYLAVNEIGIPPYFALRLTYPERVTSWNACKLRQHIINGSQSHPGATHYFEKSSTVKILPTARNYRVAISRSLTSSRTSTQSEKRVELESEGKVVYRHLKDGDIVLVNRQPTLHKPSMMAHVVRVLKGEKTLRMHYANCSTYNADFDGDEMNVHFPQDEISRAEAICIVNANQQFTVPTSGDPIRGLIQDHIVSAVLLTKRDTFLTREEYHQLLYTSFVPKASLSSVTSGLSKKICTVSLDDEMHLVPPAIWKPQPLWTGKQVITTILNYLTRGEQPFTMKKVGRIPRDYFGSTSGEDKLLIRKNDFLRGVFDKAQFGKYGLVHSVQELYGSNTAGLLLSMLSRLFTGFLQVHGFTCGINDLLVKSEDEERERKLKRSEKVGETVYSQFLGRDFDDLDSLKLQSEIERKMRSDGESATATLDRMMSSALNRLTSDVNNDLFPKGLLRPFPSNCLSLMTTTGAKGSLVNLTQISSLLGQQELEGKRVPPMVSGKTLPCFPPWDSAARSGGFISDRFLTGLRPQEYYFHCMAGREGLVDTAVKTSRSGYLQRCLIKNLESLNVCYDHTVRDVDGTVVQFCYGENGVDVHMTSYLSEFKMIAENKSVVQAKLNGRLEDATIFRSNNYLMELPPALNEKAENFICNVLKRKRNPYGLRKSTFYNLVKFKYFSSLAQPGEAVGVIAAQSVGEPSTQMTLNTFHLAGRGEMNVTLGIPRLQEILMRASEVIQTPVMTCPLLEGKTRVHADHLAAKLKKVTVADIVESMKVDVLPFALCGVDVGLLYVLKIRLYDPDFCFPNSNITLSDCHSALVFNFLRKMEDMIKLHVKSIGGISDFLDTKGKSTDDSEANHAESTGVDDDDLVDANDDNEDGVDSRKRRSQTTDEMDYDDGIGKEKRRSQTIDEMDYDDGIGKETSVVDFEQEQSMLMTENNIDEDDSDLSPGRAGQAKEDENAIFDAEDESTSQLKPSSSFESKEGHIPEATAEAFRIKYKILSKDSDRLLDFEFEGLDFRACFFSKGEPRILMAKIAQEAASKAYVKSSGRIGRCFVIELNGDPNKPAIQTAGVNFQVIWNMDEIIDVNNTSTNDIHAVLRTYGVEAARATIINEIKGVFGLYGISVNTRHLTLIADYMTVNGGYRPMSRYGIDSSTSPFSKMTFETATQFMKNSAIHGEVERLESPSSRICVGLPVKLGTGCFDIMHNLTV